MKPRLPLLLGLASIPCAAGLIWWLSATEPISASGPQRQPRDSRGAAWTSNATSAQPVVQDGADASAEEMDAIFQRLVKMRDTPERNELFAKFFKRAANLGVEPALAWVRRLQDEVDRRHALTVLGEHFFGWEMMVYGENPVTRFGIAWLSKEEATLDQIVRFANDFMCCGGKALILGGAAAKWMSDDPGRALGLSGMVEPAWQTDFITAFCVQWGTQDPKAALAWTTGIADPELRADIQALIIQGEGRGGGDLPSALQHLEMLPPESKARAETVRRLAGQWAKIDPTGAWRWQESLPADSKDRASARQGIEEMVPPTGIGVQLAAAAEDGTHGGDYPVIQGVVEGGSAAQSGQLRAGDQILAVQDARGVWTPVHNLSLADVTGLIRGAVGTDVNLRILPKGGGAPRFVRLTRRQMALPP